MNNLGAGFPALFQVWFNEIVQYEEIENWLDVEAIDRDALFRFPIIDELSGWRRREVIAFLSGPWSKDWTAEIYR